MKISKELKIGIFVITVLVASFFIINFLRGKDIFNREMEIASSYEDIYGLVISDPVYIKGYKAGTVTSVMYNQETGRFDVRCSVSRQFSIPEDSRLTIYSRDIMGGKALRIDLGISALAVGEGGILAPSVQPDMLASISADIVPLIHKLTATASNLEILTANANELLNSDNISSVSRSVKKIERIAANAESASAAIGARSSELSEFISNIHTVSVKLNGMTDRADSTMTDISGFASRLEESDIEGVVSSFKSLLEKMQDPDGTIGRLFVDGTVYDSLDSLISDIDEVVNKIKENPRKFIKISLF